jgi:hypothetical protein
MEPKFQSSFIPKGPLATSGQMAGIQQTKKHGLFGFIASGIFVISIVLAIGVFGYKLYLRSSITKMGSDLTAAKAKLDPDTIDQISRLNARLIATQTLLDNHVVLSPFFAFLEASTVKGVRFTNFEYTTNEKGITVTMKGQASGYATVALQSDIFGKTKYFKDPTFSNLDLDAKGNVIFSFTAVVDPALVSYKSEISGGQIIVPVVTAATTSSTSTPVVTQSATTTATTTKAVVKQVVNTATATTTIKH